MTKLFALLLLLFGLTSCIDADGQGFRSLMKSPNGQTPLTVVVNSDNHYVDFTIPEVLWDDVDNLIELTLNSSVTITFADNGGTCTSIVQQELKQQNSTYNIYASDLIGADTDLRFFFMPSSPATGAEQISISVDGYNSSGVLKH